MKVLQINSVCGRGSTGRITTDLADVLCARGDECRIAYGRYDVPEEYKDITVRIGTDWDVRWHGVQTRLSDTHGFGSVRATKTFLNWVREYDPDVIHLHNLHGYYINVEELFDYIKATDKPVVWTLHDCWTFTGHCAYFTKAQCEKWKTHCSDCLQTVCYPKSIVRSSVSHNFARKRATFTGAGNLTLVTPSYWLAGLLGESFLRAYPVQVIPNGIDLSVFCPTEGIFRETHGLAEKKLALGVASVWDDRKGLEDLIALSRLLGEAWRVVVVGLDAKQMEALPNNMIGIMRTNHMRELAELYTVADVFVNPTYEDNFPTTNLEALACGTPVVTYPTGGSPEALDRSCGLVVEYGPEALAEALPRVPKNSKACIERAHLYEKNRCFGEYIDLYRKLSGI